MFFTDLTLWEVVIIPICGLRMLFIMIPNEITLVDTFIKHFQDWDRFGELLKLFGKNGITLYTGMILSHVYGPNGLWSKICLILLKQQEFIVWNIPKKWHLL